MVKEIKVGKIMTKIWPVRTVVNRDVRLQIVGVRRKTVLKAQKVERERKAQAKAQTKAQLMARKEKEKESRRNMHRPSMRPERKKMPSMKRVMNPKMKRLTLLKSMVSLGIPNRIIVVSGPNSTWTQVPHKRQFRSPGTPFNGHQEPL